MDEKQLASIIQQRLGLEDQEFSLVRENPKFQRLFEHAAHRTTGGLGLPAEEVRPVVLEHESPARRHVPAVAFSSRA